jgi:hypothetical protein
MRLSEAAGRRSDSPCDRRWPLLLGLCVVRRSFMATTESCAWRSLRASTTMASNAASTLQAVVWRVPDLVVKYQATIRFPTRRPPGGAGCWLGLAPRGGSLAPPASFVVHLVPPLLPGSAVRWRLAAEAGLVDLSVEVHSRCAAEQCPGEAG